MVMRRRTLLTAAAAIIGYRKSSQDTADGASLDTGSNSAPTNQTAPGKKPNILLLCIDDLSDWVGYNNAHPGVHTPNIDRLRAQSYSFNSALSANHYLFE
jgi:hypothetical protein